MFYALFYHNLKYGLFASLSPWWITIKYNKIILFNDGPNIDKDVLNNIFSPFEKGVNGVFGLGLSIVKKTLTFLNYDINIQNTKNGVKFIIS